MLNYKRYKVTDHAIQRYRKRFKAGATWRDVLTHLCDARLASRKLVRKLRIKNDPASIVLKAGNAIFIGYVHEDTCTIVTCYGKRHCHAGLESEQNADFESLRRKKMA